MIASNMLDILTSSASMEVTLDIRLYIYSWVSMNHGRLFFYCANGLANSLPSVNHSMPSHSML